MEQDAEKIKSRIICLLRIRGPSLPIPLARETKTSSLFAGAFLSELAAEKTVRISNLKVGSSPLYFLPGQEQQLENFSNYLPGKEKEAFSLLKEKKILQDSIQEPAIRVALRSIKDFAFPFSSDNNLFWRFHSITEQEVYELMKQITIPKIQAVEITKNTDAAQTKLEISQKSKEEKKLDIFEKPAIKPKIKKAKTPPDLFFQEVKSMLAKKNITIIKTEHFDKKEVIARALDNQEILVFAYNKKKISDKELIKAFKKALEFKLPYMILIKGELSKKTKNMLDASKSLLKIENMKIDNNKL